MYLVKNFVVVGNNGYLPAFTVLPGRNESEAKANIHKYFRELIKDDEMGTYGSSKKLEYYSSTNGEFTYQDISWKKITKGQRQVIKDLDIA